MLGIQRSLAGFLSLLVQFDGIQQTVAMFCEIALNIDFERKTDTLGRAVYCPEVP
jgi:hypothetical protein